MNVIFRSVDRVNEDSILFADAGEVGAEPGFEIFGDELAAIFGAEDEVDCILGVGVRHVSRLRRFGNLYITDHSLRSGLTSAAPPALNPEISCLRSSRCSRRRIISSFRNFTASPSS